MKRTLGEAAQIRQLQREIRQAHNCADTAMRAQFLWRQRAERAEAEAAEWKQRFDRLLAAGFRAVPASDGRDTP